MLSIFRGENILRLKNNLAEICNLKIFDTKSDFNVIKINFIKYHVLT